MVIKELDGLIFTGNKARALCIAVNKEGYHGQTFLWMGSTGINYFVIPNVAAGATIKIGVESHKLTEARGIELYVGRGNSGTKLMAPDGSNNAAPTEYVDQIWQVPSDGAGANDDGTYDITIRNTNGCHMYYIDVVSGLPTVDAAKVAYVYDSTAEGYVADEDDVYATLDSFLPLMINDMRVEKIDLSSFTGSLTRATTDKYSALVLSSTIKPTDPHVAELKALIAYEPIVNMSAGLYEAWGYGKAVQGVSGTMTVADNFRTNTLFINAEDNTPFVAEDGTVKIYDTTGALVGYECEPGSYFAADQVASTIDGVNGIHIHNNGRNSYIMLPIDAAQGADYTDNYYYLVPNAAMMAIGSKKAVTPAATPTFDEEYANMNTNVTIKSTTKNAKIFYTTDGSIPDKTSTPYTGKFNVSEQGTIVKAIAYADGYDPSEMAVWAVNFYETAAEPVITVEQQDGKAIVTMETTEPGAFIYWNVSGNTGNRTSSVYGEPIEIDHNCTVYAYTGEITGSEGMTVKKQSITVSKDIVIEGKPVRTNKIGHFDANKTQWGKSFNDYTSSKSTDKAVYYTQGDKNGYDYWVGEGDTIKEKENDTVAGKEYIYFPSYHVAEPTICDPGNGWIAKSYGQGMLWEANALDMSKQIGDPENAKSYSCETALDYGASSGEISFGNVRKSRVYKNEDNTFSTPNDPYSCSIESKEAFWGPFDIVVYTTNGSGSNIPKAYMCVKTESAEQWDSIGEVKFAGTQRWFKRTHLSYEGTDKVQVKLQANFSSVQVYDIILLSGERTDGISEVGAKDNNAAVIGRTYYNLGGQRQAATGRGFYIVREQHADGSVTARKVMK